MTAYAHMCSLCDHPQSRHTLVESGELIAGPYQCALCPCQIRQDGPFYTLSKTKFEQAQARGFRTRGFKVPRESSS